MAWSFGRARRLLKCHAAGLVPAAGSLHSSEALGSCRRAGVVFARCLPGGKVLAVHDTASRNGPFVTSIC